MKRVIFAILLLSSAMMLWQCSGDNAAQSLSAEAKAELAKLPADANGMAYVNFEHVKGSVFYDMMMDSINQQVDSNEDMLEMLAKTGFDFRKDMNELYVAFNTGMIENDHAGQLIVGIGNFDADKIMSFVAEKREEHEQYEDGWKEESFNGFTLYHPEGGNENVFCFADDNYFVMGVEDRVKSWLSNHASGASSAPDAAQLALINSVRYKDGMWMTMDATKVIEALFDRMANVPELKRMEAARSLKV